MKEDTKIVRGLDEESFHEMDAYLNKSLNSHRLPIYQTSTYLFNSLEEAYCAFTGTEHHHIYARVSNPNALYVGAKVAILEGAETGIALNSGMSATLTALMTILRPGDTVIVSKPVYGGTAELMEFLMEFGIKVIFSGAERIYEDLEKLDYKVCFIETPANPTLDVFDIELISRLCKEKDAILMVDNTFATPYHQKPILLGADVVIHSTTKYLSGHGDTIGGVIVGSEEFIKKVLYTMKLFGTIMQPFNAWLTARGIRTLAVRMRKHSENALKIAQYLESREEVLEVYYPGLPSFKYYEIAKKQMQNGFSGMVSFVLDGTKEHLQHFIKNLSMFHFAVSLGDTDSLVTAPALTTHALAPITDFPENLERMCIGIEDADDLIQDIENALRKTFHGERVK
ncbi:MAG: aminotransferase class I/II-fold pyridoxal phosphate-dependent enzyme [candidate division WOR-3 bacterium]